MNTVFSTSFESGKFNLDLKIKKSPHIFLSIIGSTNFIDLNCCLDDPEIEETYLLTRTQIHIPSMTEYIDWDFCDEWNWKILNFNDSFVQKNRCHFGADDVVSFYACLRADEQRIGNKNQKELTRRFFFSAGLSGGPHFTMDLWRMCVDKGRMNKTRENRLLFPIVVVGGAIYPIHGRMGAEERITSD